MLILLSGLLLSQPAHAADSGYAAQVETWRNAEEEALRGPTSWLSMIALQWLKPGANTIGTANGSDLRLPTGSTAPKAGTFFLEGAAVSFEAAPGTTVNGEAPKGRIVVKTDATEKPDKIQAGRISITVVDRSGQIGLRVKDPEAPTRKKFAGRHWYPVRESYRVEGVFEPQVTDVVHGNAIGQTLHEPSPGTVRFELGGKTFRLLAFGTPKEGLSFVFRDKTSGKTTYGTGRFLDTEPFTGEKVTLDFNKAYSPPCAFTRFATCPLPPKANALELAVEAGEKGGGH